MAEHTVEGKGDEGGGEESEYEDIMGDCTILVKRVVINKNISPNVGERVRIRLKKEIPELDKSFPEEEVTFTLGDGDVEQAVELVTSLMKLGEKFSVIAGYKYMYGEFGQEPSVPPKANFKFEIELLSNDGIVDYPNMDFDTRFNEAKEKKERGNVLFRRKDYPQALNLYQTACKIVDRDLGFDYPQEAPEKHQEVLEFRAVILCNTSACQIKLQLFDAAILSAREATKLCPSYSKAFYRLGQAYERNGLTEETAACYRKALALHEGDGKIKLSRSEATVLQSELARLTVKQDKSKVSARQALSKKKPQAKTAEKQMYSKMFGNSPSQGETCNGDAASNGSEKAGSTDDLKDKNSGSRHDKFVKALARWTKIASHSATAAVQENPITPASVHTHAPGNIIPRYSQQLLKKKEHEKERVAMAATESQQMDPDLLSKLSQKMVAHVPHLEEDLQIFKDSLVAEMKDKEAVAMATTFLLQIGMESRPNDQKELAILDQITRRISDMIPNNIRSHVEDIAGELAREADAKYKQDQEMVTVTAACMKKKNSEVLGHKTNRRPSFTNKMVHVWEKMIKDSVSSQNTRDTRDEAPGKLDIQKHLEKVNMLNKEAACQMGYSGSLKKHPEDTNSDISDLLLEIGDPDDSSTGISDLVDSEDSSTDISDLLEESEYSEDTVSLDMSDLFKAILEGTNAAAASHPCSGDSEDEDEIEFSTSTFVGLDFSEAAAPDLLDEDLMENICTEKENGWRDSKCNDGFPEIITHETNVAAASDDQNESYVDDSSEKISAFIDGIVENILNDTGAVAVSGHQSKDSVDYSDIEIIKDKTSNAILLVEIAVELQNDGSVKNAVREIEKEMKTTHGVQEETLDATKAAASVYQNECSDTQRESVLAEKPTNDVQDKLMDDAEISAASNLQTNCSLDDSARQKFEGDTFSDYVLLEDIEDDTEASTSIQNEDSVNDSDIDVVEEDSSCTGVSEKIVDGTDTAAASGCQNEGSVDGTENQNPLLEEIVDDTGAAAPVLQNDSDIEIVEEEEATTNDVQEALVYNEVEVVASDLQNEVSVDDSDIEIVKEEATTNGVQKETVDDKGTTADSELQNDFLPGDIVDETEAAADSDAQYEACLCYSERDIVEKDTAFNLFLLEENEGDTGMDAAAAAASDIQNEGSVDDSDRDTVEEDSPVSINLDGKFDEARYVPAHDLHQDGIDDAVFTISLHFQGDKTSNASFVQDLVTEEESTSEVWDLKEVMGEDTTVSTIPDLERETLDYPSTTASDISTSVLQSELSDGPDLEPRVFELDLQDVAASLHSAVLKDASPTPLHDLQSRAVEVKAATGAHPHLQTQAIGAGPFIAAPHDLQKQVAENIQSRGFADHQKEGIETETVTVVSSLKEEIFKEKVTEASCEVEPVQKVDFEGTSELIAHYPHRRTVKDTKAACDSTTPRESSVDPEGYFTEETESTPDSSHPLKADADQAVESIVVFPAMNIDIHEISLYWMAAGIGVAALASYCIYKYARK